MVVNGDEGGAGIVRAKYDRSNRFQLGGKPVTDLVLDPSSNKVRRSKVKSMLFQRFLCTLVATHHPAPRCTLPHATTPRATNRSCSNRSKLTGEEGNEGEEEEEKEYDSWSVHSSPCLDETDRCTVVRFSNGKDEEGGRLSFLLASTKRSTRGRGSRSRETDENCRNSLRELSLAHAQNRTNSRLSLEYHGRCSKLDPEAVSLLELGGSNRGLEFAESSLISRSNSWENSVGWREEEPDRGRRRIIRTYGSRHRYYDRQRQLAEVNQVNSFASALSLSSFARITWKISLRSRWLVRGEKFGKSWNACVERALEIFDEHVQPSIDRKDIHIRDRSSERLLRRRKGNIYHVHVFIACVFLPPLSR